MDDKELAELILALQTTTPLSRVNIAEARAVFARIAELGYTITKPAPANG